MKIKVVRVSRCPPWPLWAIFIVTLWAVLVCAVVWLSVSQNRPVELCLFKWLTHIPCPTCGITRGTWHLVHGRIIQAWLCNPLMFSVGMVLLVVIGMRLFFARALHISFARYERLIAWIFAAIFLFANWFYVIIYVG
jgi:Protein of unknown function (DUF2752)